MTSGVASTPPRWSGNRACLAPTPPTPATSCCWASRQAARTPVSPPEAPPAADRVTRGAIAVLALAAVLLIASPVFRAPRMPEKVNEGGDGGHALNAFSPALSPTKPALILNNYPPLW